LPQYAANFKDIRGLFYVRERKLIPMESIQAKIWVRTGELFYHTTMRYFGVDVIDSSAELALQVGSCLVVYALDSVVGCFADLRRVFNILYIAISP